MQYLFLPLRGYSVLFFCLCGLWLLQGALFPVASLFVIAGIYFTLGILPDDPWWSVCKKEPLRADWKPFGGCGPWSLLQDDQAGPGSWELLGSVLICRWGSPERTLPILCLKGIWLASRVPTLKWEGDWNFEHLLANYLLCSHLMHPNKLSLF